MNIFILEDDFIQQERIESIIAKLLAKHQIQPKLFEVFGKPDQLLACVEEKGAHQLFFLDIEIKAEEQKGLEVAKKIRESDPYAAIVFVTSHSEFMPLSFQYQLSALNYIDKELPSSQFEDQIEAAILQIYRQNSKGMAGDSFYFKSKYAQIQYPFDQLLYIETSSRPHRVILYTKTDRTEFTANLSDIVANEKRLVQCYRSFAINPAHVVKVDKREKVAYLSNGASCLIARNKMESILEAMDKLHRRRRE